MPRGRTGRLALALLAVALVGGLGLRLVALGGKDAIAHDEAITYIASTCHQGEYDELTTSGAPPFGA